MTDPETRTATGAEESPLVKAIRDGSAPSQVKVAAARGALPVDRPVLFGLLVLLRSDADQQVKAAAEQSLGGWSDEELQELAHSPQTLPEALSYILTERSDSTDVLASLLSNGSTPLPALETAAREFPAAKLDTLLLNQTLLIRYPGLLDLLETNASLTPLHQNRIREIRHHFLGEAHAGAPQASPARPAVPPAEGEAASGQVPAGSPATEEGAPRTGPGPATVPVAEAVQEDKARPEAAKGVYERIVQMNVNEKITLAGKGSKEERSLLIRESNRSVQVAVIKSPKLTEQEVEGIAKMRNVNEEVLRAIASRRDWMKNYAIIHGLAYNPKTPLGISMSLLPRLVLKDLKMMLKDKNVPENLRRMARKNIEMRDRRPGGGGR